MRLPPTPPEDPTNQQSGYATPVNASNPLTPNRTPPKMSNTAGSGRPHMDSGRKALSAEERVLDERKSNRNESRGYTNHIPVVDEDLTEHLQGRNPPTTPDLSPASRRDPSSLRVRKKRGQNDIHSTPESKSIKSATDNWNDLPDDMIVNEQVYKQIQRKNMDRLEAIQDGRAIEAVVTTTDSARKPSLRKVKKRHSLRLGSDEMKDVEAQDDGSITANETRRIASLKHKKAFPASRQSSLNQSQLENLSNTSMISTRTLRHERRPLSADGRLQPAPQPRHVSLPTHMHDTQLHEHGLRRISKQSRVENLAAAKRIESVPTIFQSSMLDTPSPNTNNYAFAGLSPSIKSHRFTNTQTPMSGFSDRTEMELCEAKNVTLFPHSNDSVLLINNGNAPISKSIQKDSAPHILRPLSFTFENPEPSTSTTSSASLSRGLSTPEIQINGLVKTADSPLTNPRPAPLPPAIQFIPPTPSTEGDRQLTVQETSPGIQRRVSLLKTARRLSDSILTPIFSRTLSHKQRRPQTATTGNDRLHPMWTPNSMWDDDDDEYSDDDDDYEYNDYERLPAGGDTSDHPRQGQQHARGLFPRQMSVRMPGFRGTGGFLLGNSLGVERHGTNRRRHHVDLPAKQQRTSTGFLQRVKKRVRGLRAAREATASERRRAELKNSIGVPVVHRV